MTGPASRLAHQGPSWQAPLAAGWQARGQAGRPSWQAWAARCECLQSKPREFGGAQVRTCMKSLSQAGPSGKSLSHVGRSEGGPGNHFLKFARVKVVQYTNYLYIYIYILVWTRAYPCTEQSSAECSGSEHSATETSFCEQRSRTARSKSLFERTGGTEAGSNSLFERTGGTGQARTAFSSAFLSLFASF